MSRSVLYMSMSLDGYIAGPNDKPDNPGGDDFMRLHDWFGFTSGAGPTAETNDESAFGKHFLDEIRDTGAVLSGRNTVEQADHWGGDHHDGVPIFVPSPKTSDKGSVTVAEHSRAQSDEPFGSVRAAMSD
jgi:dihydrofolate reductase